MTERLDGVFAGGAVRGGTSPIHGLGLFAERNIEAGEVIALHPVHRVMQSLDNGQIAGALAEEDDEAYFRPPPGSIDADDLAYRQVQQ